MDIYSKKFKQLTVKEKAILSLAIETLLRGDVLWHDSTSVWGWALGFIQNMIDAASLDHPQTNCYVEFLKDNQRYGVSIIRTEE